MCAELITIHDLSPKPSKLTSTPVYYHSSNVTFLKLVIFTRHFRDLGFFMPQQLKGKESVSRM